ncbi:MAG: ribosome biogenesis factor YjgA [Methylophagaceae bacterium]
MANNNYWQGGTYHEDRPDEKSKSQVKRELQALKDLGKELLELSMKDLDKLDLSERLYESVIKAHGMTHGARKRQIGFIGGLMVHEDYDLIQQGLEKVRQVDNSELKLFHQLEQWRDDLLAGDSEVMTILRHQFKDIDIQHIRQLVRNANKETTQNKPAKSARLLFKYLQYCQSEIA